MSDIDVTGNFKKAGEDVRVVIAHSTKNALGQDTIDAFRAKLGDVVVVAEARVGTLKELLELVQSADDFNVLLVVMHGDGVENEAHLFADVDVHGKPLGLKGAELALLAGSLDDKLCLFGICHFGTADLAQAVCSAGALVCIAPKPGKRISNIEIIDGFSALLKKMQEQKGAEFGVENLDRDLLPALDKKFGMKSTENLLGKLSVQKAI
jgi:hypothetical protein